MNNIDSNNLIINDSIETTKESFYSANMALKNGYNKSLPIVIDYTGFILDGNHRYIRFRDACRLDEISIIMIDKQDKIIEYNKEMTKKKYGFDNIYYPFVKKIGKWIQK